MIKKIAFVFPGQGSQTVGMLDAFEGNVVVQSTLQEASVAIGFDIGEMIHSGPSETLALTENTQPLMLTSAIAIYRAWLSAGGLVPEMMAGHSLGEYTALVAAGSIAFADAVPLVRFRAQAMQDAVPVGEGGMAAIMGVDDDVVRKLCQDSQVATGRLCEAVNFNAPNQVVIAGYKEAVQYACDHAKEVGARMAVPLPVSAPFHSSLLRPAAEKLSHYLQKITILEPGISIINNVDVMVINDPHGIKDALTRQAFSPVRWVETIQSMVMQGVTHIVECGPGKVLSGMVKRINGDVKILSISDPNTISQALEELNT
jgi:[acyl-carrier-protein] S-malonyltransferase